MRVCFFGGYSRKHTRFKVLKKGLEENEVEAIECHLPLLSHKYFASSRLRHLPQFYLGTIYRYFWLLGKIFGKRYDILLVGFPAFCDVPLAKLIAFITGKKVVYDAFVSKYYTAVFDRKFAKKGSLKAKIQFVYDKWPCKLADLVLLDTDQQINYFIKWFGLKRKKFLKVPVGSAYIYRKNSELKKGKKFVVLYFGTYIPFHGLQHVIHAAKELEAFSEIKFQLLGNGQIFQKIFELSKKLGLKNVKFLDEVSYEKLQKIVEKADIVLGVFGTEEKTQIVVPTKVFDAIALGKVVLTAESIALKEMGFVHKKNVFFVKAGKPKEIAEAILFLKKNNALRKKIERNAFKLFRENFSTKKVGEILKNKLQEIIEN